MINENWARVVDFKESVEELLKARFPSLEWKVVIPIQRQWSSADDVEGVPSEFDIVVEPTSLTVSLGLRRLLAVTVQGEEYLQQEGQQGRSLYLAKKTALMRGMAGSRSVLDPSTRSLFCGPLGTTTLRADSPICLLIQPENLVIEEVSLEGALAAYLTLTTSGFPNQNVDIIQWQGESWAIIAPEGLIGR